MSGTRTLRASIRYALFLSISCAPGAPGQEPTELQARTPDEFDAYLLADAASTPAQRVERTAAFLARWPDSALRGPVALWKMEAHRDLDQGEAALEAGRLALDAQPSSAPALATMAELLVNLRQAPADIDLASQHARRVLDLVSTGITVPGNVPLEAWRKARSRYEARAWAVIGQVAFKQGMNAPALDAFARAVAVEPEFDAARHLRYGLLLQAAGREADAVRELQAVAERGTEPLRARARAALGR
ncbi:MAG: hypothetical protein FJW40_03115 [Acidobacteria bacterium]|nr:hypothetical protein [Acidobacteriota bacterium]